MTFAFTPNHQDLDPIPANHRHGMSFLWDELSQLGKINIPIGMLHDYWIEWTGCYDKWKNPTPDLIYDFKMWLTYKEVKEIDPFD